MAMSRTVGNAVLDSDCIVRMTSRRISASLMKFYEIPKGTIGQAGRSVGTVAGFKVHPRMRLVLALVLLVALDLCPGGTLVQAQTTPTVATVALARDPDRFYQPATVAGQLVANLV